MSNFINTMETVVAPTLGTVLSTLTFSAPITSLRSAVQAGSLGNLNPTPWAFMLGNTVGWIAYAFITRDMYVFFANVFGLIFSIYLNIGAMKLQYYDDVRKSSPSIQLAVADAVETNTEQNDNEHDDTSPTNGVENSNTDELKEIHLRSFTAHEIKVLLVIIIWVFILSITSLASKSRETMEKAVGISVNINLMLFYGAPLSTISTIIRLKSSSTIHFWTMVMNTLNSFFWCIYAFAIEDYYILIPNGIGFTFGLIQVLLYCIFPRDQTDVRVEGAQQFLGDGANGVQENENEII